MNPQLTFKYEYYDTIEEIIDFIRQDEGHCTQQSVYSTFHDALTQINFTKRIIRTNVKI